MACKTDFQDYEPKEGATTWNQLEVSALTIENDVSPLTSEESEVGLPEDSDHPGVFHRYSDTESILQ